MPDIITDISLETFNGLVNTLPSDSLIIIRFTAEWCGPCQRINGICDEYFKKCSNKIFPVVIDVDESIDLYVRFKRQKMLNGIPALLAYHGNNKQDVWYVPNDCILDGDIEKVKAFFNRCSTHINNVNKN